MLTITIEQCDNGYIITKSCGEESDKMVVAIKDTGDRHDEIIALKELIWILQESLGLYGNKYEKCNLKTFCTCEEDEEEVDVAVE